MALIGNNSILNRNANRHFSGGAASGYYGGMNPPNAQKNRFNSLAIDAKSGTPIGYLPYMSWVLPIKPGGMSFYADKKILTVTNADAKMGRNLVATSAMVITLVNAQADQIIPMVADASLVISKDDAAMSAGVQAVANSTMTITDSAELGGIIPVVADSACVMSTNVTMTALAFMEAEAGGPTELSPEGLAQAVWDAILSDHLDTGTTGKALSDAGGAGNPWSALLNDNNDPGTFGERVRKLLTTSKFIGLE